MSSPNRNILSDIFCIGVFFLCHLPVVCTVFFTGIFCGSQLNQVKTDSKWSTQTEISGKYKQISPTDVLSKILSM